MESGKWKVESGEWRVESGELPMHITPFFRTEGEHDMRKSDFSPETGSLTFNAPQSQD